MLLVGFYWLQVYLLGLKWGDTRLKPEPVFTELGSQNFRFRLWNAHFHKSYIFSYCKSCSFGKMLIFTIICDFEMYEHLSKKVANFESHENTEKMENGEIT